MVHLKPKFVKIEKGESQQWGMNDFAMLPGRYGRYDYWEGSNYLRPEVFWSRALETFKGTEYEPTILATMLGVPNVL